MRTSAHRLPFNAWTIAGTALLAAAALWAAASGLWAMAVLVAAAGGALRIGLAHPPAFADTLPVATLAEPPAEAAPIAPLAEPPTQASASLGPVPVLPTNARALRGRLRDDLVAAQPLLETLRGQIDGALQDAEAGVMSVVGEVQSINQLSTDQRAHIAQSVSGVDLMREAVEVPGAIISQLTEMLAERDEAIATNYAGLGVLSREFQELRSAVDVISQIADKAFFLAINASVEAHRQGSAGQAFALIATEMRALATQTAEGARQVGQRINAFADRMQVQIAAAMPGSSDEGTDDVLRLLQDLENAQAEVAAIGARLGSLIGIMESGHSAMVHSLSDILGRLQFHDVMRQRLGQVADALGDLKAIVAQPSSGASVRSLLEAQGEVYVMESQKQVHAQATLSPGASGAAMGSAALKIELF